MSQTHPSDMLAASPLAADARPRQAGRDIAGQPALALRAAEIVVRPAEPGDAAALHRLYGQAHIVRNTGAPAFASLAQTAAWAADASADGHLLVATAGAAIAGALALRSSADPLRRHCGEISRMAVDAAWQGRGVATGLLRSTLELADSWLNLLRLELHVRADNQAAIALYRKFGFVQEGLMRGFAFRDGAYADGVAMARLRGPLREASP